MSDLTRRAALGGMVGVGVLSLAGCVSDEQDDGEENGQADEEPEVVGSEIESSGTERSSEGDRLLGYDIEDDTVTINGELPSPDPCHEAVLGAVELEGSELSIDVDVDDISGDEACVQVLGRVEYQVTVELTNAQTVETVTAGHETGGTHRLTKAEVDEGHGASGETDEPGVEPPEVVDYSISTEGSDCGSSGSAGVDKGDTLVTIDGVAMASNPCHEATIEDVSVNGGELQVDIGLASVLEEDEPCIECVGEIAYAAEIELDDAGKLAEVTVNHPNGGQFSSEDADDGGETDTRDDQDIVDSTLISVESQSRSETYDTATIDIEAGTISIDGVLPSSTPHYRAYLGDIEHENGTVSVEVGVRSTLGDDEAGTQQLGEVQYEAEIHVADDVLVDTVVVDHLSGDSHST